MQNTFNRMQNPTLDDRSLYLKKILTSGSVSVKVYLGRLFTTKVATRYLTTNSCLGKKCRMHACSFC